MGIHMGAFSSAGKSCFFVLFRSTGNHQKRTTALAKWQLLLQWSKPNDSSPGWIGSKGDLTYHPHPPALRGRWRDFTSECSLHDMSTRNIEIWSSEVKLHEGSLIFAQAFTWILDFSDSLSLNIVDASKVQTLSVPQMWKFCSTPNTLADELNSSEPLIASWPKQNQRPCSPVSQIVNLWAQREQKDGQTLL